MAQEKLEQLRNAVNELKNRKGYTNSWLSEIASKKAIRSQTVECRISLAEKKVGEPLLKYCQILPFITV